MHAAWRGKVHRQKCHLPCRHLGALLENVDGWNRDTMVGSFPNLTSTVSGGSIVSGGEEGESQAALQLLSKLLLNPQRITVGFNERMCLVHGKNEHLKREGSR